MVNRGPSRLLESRVWTAGLAADQTRQIRVFLDRRTTEPPARGNTKDLGRYSHHHLGSGRRRQFIGRKPPFMCFRGSFVADRGPRAALRRSRLGARRRMGRLRMLPVPLPPASGGTWRAPVASTGHGIPERLRSGDFSTRCMSGSRGHGRSGSSGATASGGGSRTGRSHATSTAASETTSTSCTTGSFWESSCGRRQRR